MFWDVLSRGERMDREDAFKVVRESSESKLAADLFESAQQEVAAVDDSFDRSEWMLDHGFPFFHDVEMFSPTLGRDIPDDLVIAASDSSTVFGRGALRSQGALVASRGAVVVNQLSFVDPLR